jgi:triosephosphate isomerase (TIM)
MRPLIAGNWKMHGTAAQLAEITAIAAAVRTAAPDADMLICPPSTLITRAVQTASNQIAIGGQNCSAEISGAFTGDLSAEMLKDAGAAWVIVGHSERRQHHGETEAQRRSGNALSACAAQLAGSVPDGIIAAGNAIGYEPLWAIGTGHTPTIAQVADVHGGIRQCLVARFGAPGKDIRILYGGSVNQANARKFLSVPEVGGALIGGASLQAKDFNAIIRALPVQAARVEHSAVA